MFNFHPDSPAAAVFKLADDIRTVRQFSRGMAEIGRQTNNDFLRVLFEPIEGLDYEHELPVNNFFDLAVRFIAGSTR